MSTRDHHGQGVAAAQQLPPATAGLPEATRPEVVELGDGDEFELEIVPVAKRIGDATVRMLAYNGSIPGPTLEMPQGSTATVRVTNRGDLEATVHWHGLRLENRGFQQPGFRWLWREFRDLHQRHRSVPQGTADQPGLHQRDFGQPQDTLDHGAGHLGSQRPGQGDRHACW